ncbi:MAG: hypothetical protein ACKOQ8_07725 [Micrococcales bacterium]
MNLEDFDKEKLTLPTKQKKSKEQKLYEAVLAAAIAADRQGLFLEVQTILDQDPALRAEDVELIFPSERFQNAMEKRGIKTTKNPNLTLRQETFLQAYLNPLNLLTPQVLAKRMKISLTELDGWMRQKAFGEAMSAKAEDNLRKYIPIADQALGQLVQSGDMKAITFLNQLTGRFDPNARSGSIDIPAMLMQVQDIILRHVTDAAVKRNIARELIALASGQSHFTALPEPTPTTDSATIEVEAE